MTVGGHQLDAVFARLQLEKTRNHRFRLAVCLRESLAENRFRLPIFGEGNSHQAKVFPRQPAFRGIPGLPGGNPGRDQDQSLLGFLVEEVGLEIDIQIVVPLG